MGLFDSFKKKIPLEKTLENSLKDLEKKIGGNLNKPDIGSMNQYISAVEKFKKQGYDMQKYSETCEVYLAVMKTQKV
jgi:hypothetical protein